MIKAKHKANLLKLADYLATLPDDYEQFDMSEYMVMTDGDGDYLERFRPDERSKPVCGTVACAVGHGPAAGICLYGDLDWTDYAERVFGKMCCDDFQYMFGSEWSNYDNTPKGAASRICAYVALGHAPEGWDFEDAKVLS